MNKKRVIIALACCTMLIWAMARQSPASGPSVDGGIQTKVSESRKSGKYKRITETSNGKVLISRTEEVSLKNNGKIDYVFFKLFREGEMTFSSTLHNSEKRTIRSYYHGGKMFVEEGDEDGDGFFETMILFDANEQPVEAFSKGKDGAVAQFGSEKLAELKKSFEKFQE